MQGEILNNNLKDKSVSLAKGIAGAIPIAGAIVSEIISTTIPNQRIDRITTFIKLLEEKINETEKTLLLNNKYTLDIFEDGLFLAARSLSEQRNHYIVNFLCNELNLTENEYHAKKKLFQILSDLTELDIDILMAIDDQGIEHAKHVLTPHPVTIGSYNNMSDSEKYDYDLAKDTFSAYVATLERFGLIAPERRLFDPDTIDNIDEDTALPEIIGYRITDLGYIFIKSIS